MTRIGVVFCTVMQNATQFQLYINRSPQPRWQTHNSVDNGLSCRENFGKCLTWAEPGQKADIFPVSSAQPTGKVLLQTNSTMDSVHSEGVPFGGFNPPDIKNPNPRKILGSRNLCNGSYRTQESSRNSTVRLFLKLEQNGISPENWFWGYKMKMGFWHTEPNARHWYDALVSV